MLMATNSIDYFQMPENQAAIHKRLENWARWVKPHHTSAIHPMFRQARSNARQWHQPEIQEQIDSIDAMKVEKAVRQIPIKHAASLRWWYVKRTGERKARQELALTQQGLADMVVAARYMLTNILRM